MDLAGVRIALQCAGVDEVDELTLLADGPAATTFRVNRHLGRAIFQDRACRETLTSKHEPARASSFGGELCGAEDRVRRNVRRSDVRVFQLDSGTSVDAQRLDRRR